MRDSPIPEYHCQVALLFRDDELVPSGISAALGMRPNQAWQRGALNILGQPHESGGWKKSPPPSKQRESLSAQLSFWCNRLREHRSALEEVEQRTYICALNCHVFTSSTASIIISPALLRAVAELGLELRLSVIVQSGETQNGA